MTECFLGQYISEKKIGIDSFIILNWAVCCDHTPICDCEKAAVAIVQSAAVPNRDRK